MEDQGRGGIVGVDRQSLIGNPVGNAVGKDILLTALMGKKNKKENEHCHHQVGPGNGPVYRPGGCPGTVKRILHHKNRLRGPVPFRPCKERF